jgi:hypothetical protein
LSLVRTVSRSSATKLINIAELILGTSPLVLLGNVPLGKANYPNVLSRRPPPQWLVSRPRVRLDGCTVTLAKITAPIAGLREIEPSADQSLSTFMSWPPRLASEVVHAWLREQVRAAARSSRSK